MKCLIFLLGMMTAVSFAADKKTDTQLKWCHTSTWADPVPETLKQLKIQFDQMQRDELIRITWNELIKKPVAGKLSIPLLHYLSATENNKVLRGYYQTMGAVVAKGKLPDELVETWPSIPKLSVSPFTLERHCDLFSQAGGKLN